jgi:DNA polymerase-3 subunit delta'
MVGKFYAIKSEKDINKGTIISTVFAVIVAGGCYFLGGFGRLFSADIEALGGIEKTGFDAIIPTILSRTQMIHVPVIEESALANVFGNKIAHIANGNYIKALEISKQEYSNSENLEIYRALMLCAFSKDLIALKNLTESISGKSREFIKNFLNYAQFITRECFISHLQNASLNYMEDSETAFADKFKRFLNVENIENIMELFNTASRDINQNVNTKIVLFDLGINLMTQIKK